MHGDDWGWCMLACPIRMHFRVGADQVVGMVQREMTCDMWHIRAGRPRNLTQHIMVGRPEAQEGRGGSKHEAERNP